MYQCLSSEKFFINLCRHYREWSSANFSSQTMLRIASEMEKSKSLQTEKIVITGGGGELGRNLAIRLAKMDATVAVWDEDKIALAETRYYAEIAGIKQQMYTYTCDLSQKNDIYKVAEATKKDLGQVTMIINNAEISSEKLLLDTPDYLIQKTFQINVLSHFWLAKAFLPNMIEDNRGHIITISSMAGHMGIQKLTDYCATKAAAINFLTALKTELEREGNKGIKITIVCPYFMKSENLHGAAKLRILRGYTPREVADRTVQAIRNAETIVFMPAWFKFALSPRWICPGSLTSLAKRILIKDPNPVPTAEEEPMKAIEYVKVVRPIEVAVNKTIKTHEIDRRPKQT